MIHYQFHTHIFVVEPIYACKHQLLKTDPFNDTEVDMSNGTMSQERLGCLIDASAY